ncbi:type IV pilus assembly protein PilP [Kushneria sinocarnis]|uniref:Type IV pilus assembly protein PilP n=1 Tax=Kushneria sinocarnis TaxID=595502 RepID=A0A420WXB6_9GAMM|nr:pilus assembly protein PilP [Kushneria sinocarnis]RKR04399.1 type IV pilus assembly protein PilP [Kushneria sinocarnis]
MSGCRVRVAALLLGLLLGGCQHPDIDALDAHLQALRERPTGHVEALPEQPLYHSIDYEPGERRAPFTPWLPAARAGADDSTIRPDPQRPRDPLESFALDTLRLAGTFTIHGRTMALIQTPDGEVVRLRPGEHLGEHDGRVETIDSGRLVIVELIADGRGGFTTERRQLTLSATGAQRTP